MVVAVLGLADADARAPFAGFEQSELEDLVARLIASPQGQAILVLGPPPQDPIVPDRVDLTVGEILRA